MILRYGWFDTGGQWFFAVVNHATLCAQWVLRGGWWFFVWSNVCAVVTDFAVWSIIPHFRQWFCTEVNDSVSWAKILPCGQWFCVIVKDSTLWSMILRCGQRFCGVFNDFAQWSMILRCAELFCKVATLQVFRYPCHGPHWEITSNSNFWVNTLFDNTLDYFLNDDPFWKTRDQMVV
jgi:hypothetical protein